VYGEVLIFSIFIFLKVGGKNADQPRVMIFTEKNVRVIMQSYIPVYIFFFKECFFPKECPRYHAVLFSGIHFFLLCIRCTYVAFTLYIYILYYTIFVEKSQYTLFIYLYFNTLHMRCIYVIYIYIHMYIYIYTLIRCIYYIYALIRCICVAYTLFIYIYYTHS